MRSEACSNRFGGFRIRPHSVSARSWLVRGSINLARPTVVSLSIGLASKERRDKNVFRSELELEQTDLKTSTLTRQEVVCQSILHSGRRISGVYNDGNVGHRPDAFITAYRQEGGRWIERVLAEIEQCRMLHRF
jgi:hypothetical protein